MKLTEESSQMLRKKPGLLLDSGWGFADIPDDLPLSHKGTMRQTRFQTLTYSQGYFIEAGNAARRC